MSRWFGRVKLLGFTTLALCGGWKARAAWDEMVDASKPAASVLTRLSRVPGYFFSESEGVTKDRRIRELEAKLHAASEKNEELQMCLDAQSNRHEFLSSPPTSTPPPQQQPPQRP